MQPLGGLAVHGVAHRGLVDADDAGRRLPARAGDATFAPVRVVAGELRGRRLVAPPGSTTRPTSDRVREATFNALGSLGAIEDAVVLDLFAGSGALGIEALSRGAAQCTFVERDRAALAALRANLDALPARRRSGHGACGATPPVGPWDLALLDPPYAFDGWTDLLRRARDRPVERRARGVRVRRPGDVPGRAGWW